MQKHTENKREQVLKTNTEELNDIGVRDNNLYRDLFKVIINSKPTLLSITLNEDNEGTFNGHVSFSVGLTDIGLSVANICMYKREFNSPFFAFFVGELLVRENLDDFIEKVQEMGPEDYYNSCQKIHKTFGMRIKNGKELEFIFHVSLLKKIVSEEFKISLNK